MTEACRLLPQLEGSPQTVFLSFNSSSIVSPELPTSLVKAAISSFPSADIVLTSEFVQRPNTQLVNDIFSQVAYEEGCQFLDVSDSIEAAHVKNEGTVMTFRGSQRLADCLVEAAVLSPDPEYLPCLARQDDVAQVFPDDLIIVDAYWADSDESNPQWCFQANARLFIQATIGGVAVQALLDSGATNSLMPSRMIPILTSKGVKVEPTDRQLTLADGSPSSVVGKALIPLNVGDKVWVGEFFFVSSFPYEAILGVDSMRGLKMSIDFSTPCVTMKGSSNRTTAPLIHLCSVQLENDFFPEDVFEVSPSVSHPDLDESHYSRFRTFIDQWKTEFASSRGLTSVSEHKIYLEANVPPVRQKNYPMSPHIQETVEAEIEKLLEKGHIEPSTSPWCSPLVIVSKKNGEKRVCVDFRTLNRHTIKNSYPLPHLQSVLDSLKDSRIVSSIDLKSGFHQIPLNEESKALTAFSAPGNGGLFQYRVMPFGLCNAPASFQHLMNVVLRPLLVQRKVHVYMDDLIVATKTYEEHLAVLEETFRLLRNAELVVNWSKSTFLQPELEYLGHIVGQGKLRASPSKISAVLEYAPPRSVRQVRSFLGACAWFKRFIPGFSDLAEPLTRLLRKSEPWSWNEEQQKSFEELRKCLVSPPILSCPDFSKPFVIETDASNVGLGAVLRQEIDGSQRVVAYASRTLNRAERNLSTTHKELLGILFGVEKYRPYVEGAHFTVITDHSALQWLRNLHQPTGKFARWILRLDMFDFNVIHRKGCQMALSDCLSRAPYNLSTSAEDEGAIEVAVVSIRGDLKDSKDPWYLQLINKVNSRPDAYPAFRVEEGRLLKRIEDRLLKKTMWLVVVPSEHRLPLLEHFHSSPAGGHMGFARTLARIRTEYYWANMAVDVRAFVARCKTCQQFKAPNVMETGEMTAEPPSMKPMSVLSIDFIGPLPKSSKQNRFAVVILDVATKYVIARPVRSATSKSAIKVLEDDVLFVHGTPDVLMADNGSAFASHDFKAFCESHQVRLHHVPKYYARGNPVERANRTLKTAISIYAHDQQRHWCSHLRHVTFAMNSSVSEVTSFSPHRLLFGRELRSGFCLFSQIEEQGVSEFNAAEYHDTMQYELALVYERALASVVKAKQRQAGQYNLRHRAVHFAKGDLVWRRNFALSQGADGIAAKLLPKFVGPFVVSAVLSPNQYQLSALSGKDVGRWPATHLKLVV